MVILDRPRAEVLKIIILWTRGGRDISLFCRISGFNPWPRVKSVCGRRGRRVRGCVPVSVCAHLRVPVCVCVLLHIKENSIVSESQKICKALTFCSMSRVCARTGVLLSYVCNITYNYNIPIYGVICQYKEIRTRCSVFFVDRRRND